MKQKQTKNSLNGIYTAIVTPFQNNKIDYDSFLNLCKLQLDAGVDGIVIAGTTGESPTLDASEKIELIKRAREALGDKIKIMGGSGSNNTADSVQLSRQMAKAGADSLLVVTPPYNKPSALGLKRHFETVAAATDLPVCLYHVPGRTSQKLTALALSELCTIKNIEAVKEASADLALFSKANELSDSDYLSGDDFTFLPSLSVGGRGVVSVLTNVFPKAFVDLYQSFNGGNFSRALEIHHAVYEFTEALFIESNPSPTKFVLSTLGLCKNELRLPLAEVTPASEKVLIQLYEDTLRKLQVLEERL
jgi:4-hydroxy-tetrahydrodipicolinate synthase